MQRKNNILKSSRNAIAMIMAIAVILIISGIMALSLSMTATTTKRTVDLYIYEQAVLLSKSATEFALLKIAQGAPCSNNAFNFTHDDIYNIDITLNYIYTTPLPALCINDGTANDNVFAIVNTPEQNGSVVMDVRVSVNDGNITSEPITFFRRSIQKL